MPVARVMHKKILLVGVFSSSASVYCYADSFGPALSRLGFDVSMFHYRRSFLPFISDAQALRWPFLYMNKKMCNQALLRIVRQFRPDIVFVIKGELITAKTLHTIKYQYGSRLIHFYPDDPFALWNGNSNKEVLASLPLCHHVLTWSHDLVNKLQRHGCSDVSYFPFAFDQDLFNQDVTITPEDRKKYTCDICFVGTWEPDREQWIHKLLERMPQVLLFIWGNDWDNNCQSSLVRLCLKGPALYGLEMIKLFRCSTIVLNFLRKQNELSHNMRSFEIPASRAFQLAQRSHEHGSLLFQERETIVCFDSLDELQSMIAHFLTAHEEREKLITQGFSHVQNYGLTSQLSSTLSKLNVLSSHG